MNLWTKMQANIFLKLMKQIQIGSLEIVMPDGKIYQFNGKKLGYSGKLIIKNLNAIPKILSSSDIGLAESYRDGLVSSPDMLNLLLLCIENQNALLRIFRGNYLGLLIYKIRHFFRSNTRKRSRKNIQAHYDLGNNFNKLWLDPSMTYSSALFNSPIDSLEQAQKNKYQRIIETLNPNKNDHILEVGCGWGGFAVMVAKQSGCRITCLTLSDEQFKYAQELVIKEGLQDLVTIKICDYRDEKGVYDHVVSIEMIEAVGEDYWGQYFAMINEKLKPGGKAMIQSIYMIDELFDNYRRSTDFIQQYIFPGGMVLAPKVFKKYSDQNNLIMKDFFKFGLDYAKTLNHWRDSFRKQLEIVKSIGFDEPFLKLWDFYYIYCEAGFISRRIDVAQIVFEKKN